VTAPAGLAGGAGAAAAGLLRRGDRGPRVQQLRGLLPGPAATGTSDDVFDGPLEVAVRAFQQQRGLLADGLVGPQTSRVLDAARWALGDRILLFTPGHLMRGDDIAALQERLVTLGLLAGPVDGVFGTRTDAGLRELQRGLGLEPDGLCGPATLRALGTLARAVGGGDPWALRQQAEVAGAGPRLAGKVVVLDPGHGGHDPGVIANDRTEADLVLDVARRVEGRLAATGVTPVLTRGGGASGRHAIGPDAGERSDLAARVGADLVITLHCDAHHHPAANGVATFFWGDDRVGARSATGAHLAGLIQREVVARTGLTDLRTHARTYELFRVTRMPAVRVELGYLTNPGDAGLLGLAGTRDAIAEALVVAVQRLYLADEDDATTGTLRLDDILALGGNPLLS
jgi:N-acetylmuramoyl-L-alanine amidase